MKSHWCVHMKNGHDFSFENQARYIDTKDGMLYVMKNRSCRIIFAVIPIDNILWVENVPEEEEAE